MRDLNVMKHPQDRRLHAYIMMQLDELERVGTKKKNFGHFCHGRKFKILEKYANLGTNFCNDRIFG